MDYISVGKRIKNARKRNGYTQAELAEHLGCSIQHISHVENGSTKMSIDFVLSLANLLKISLDELFIDNLPFLQKNLEENNLAELIRKCNDTEKDRLVKILTPILTDIDYYISLLKE